MIPIWLANGTNYDMEKTYNNAAKNDCHDRLVGYDQQGFESIAERNDGEDLCGIQTTDSSYFSCSVSSDDFNGGSGGGSGSNRDWGSNDTSSCVDYCGCDLSGGEY